MGKKLERLTLPPQIRIEDTVKREIVLTAEADRRSVNDHIRFLLELGLKLRNAIQLKEAIVHVRQCASLEVS